MNTWNHDHFWKFPNGVYSSKWRPAARAKGGGHSQTRGRAGVTEMSGSTVSAAWAPSPRPVRPLSFTLSKSASDPSMWTPNVLRSFLVGGRGLKNRQKPLRVIFLPTLACRDQSQIIDLDRGSGHSSCTCTVNPKNSFFVVVSGVLHFTSFPFSFFFPPVVALHKHWRILDHLTASSRASATVATLPWRQDFGRGGYALVDFERSLSELHVSCGFSCCCFFLFFFFSLIFSLPFFFLFFLCGDFELFFFFGVEIASESTLIEASFARQSISSLPARPRPVGPLRQGQESWVFRCPQCSRPSKMGSTAPRPSWCPWKKKTWTWGCLQT